MTPQTDEVDQLLATIGERERAFLTIIRYSDLRTKFSTSSGRT